MKILHFYLCIGSSSSCYSSCSSSCYGSCRKAIFNSLVTSVGLLAVFSWFRTEIRDATRHWLFKANQFRILNTKILVWIPAYFITRNIFWDASLFSFAVPFTQFTIELFANLFFILFFWKKNWKLKFCFYRNKLNSRFECVEYVQWRQPNLHLGITV